MTDLCIFRIPLTAANAIGVLRPDFLATILINDGRLTCTVDDDWCRIECSRDVALVIASKLQRDVRGGVTPLAIGAACSEAAAIIYSAIRRSDADARRDCRSSGGMTQA